MNEVDELRAGIEAVDRQIVERVAERVDLARRLGELKREQGAATMDPEREASVIRRAVAAARDHGLPAEGTRELFWTLISLCRTAQLEDR